MATTTSTFTRLTAAAIAVCVLEGCDQAQVQEATAQQTAITTVRDALKLHMRDPRSYKENRVVVRAQTYDDGTNGYAVYIDENSTNAFGGPDRSIAIGGTDATGKLLKVLMDADDATGLTTLEPVAAVDAAAATDADAAHARATGHAERPMMERIDAELKAGGSPDAIIADSAKYYAPNAEADVANQKAYDASVQAKAKAEENAFNAWSAAQDKKAAADYAASDVGKWEAKIKAEPGASGGKHDTEVESQDSLVARGRAEIEADAAARAHSSAAAPPPN